MRSTVLSRSGTAATIAALVFTFSSGVASAAPDDGMPASNPAAITDTTPSTIERVSADGLDSKEFERALSEAAHELEQSDLARRVDVVGDVEFFVYTLEDGRELGIPAALTQPSPLVSGGPAIAGPWIELTPLEQQMLAGGATGFLAAALCAGSFGAACGIAGAVAGAAMAYVGTRGVCPNNQRMLIEFTWGGNVRGAACR
ncbi:hypothetical protein [Corynebacterium alimapuense]|uniref:Secreted protein n=1 Tax=Corynebacterium alimapuense TaxID=1576874 RepID=A0A3M8K6K8_9CORY|nr:hypothetical protein [Corynebacterium alimapuense]RNE48134.1 hypothetical protein C5L39_09670 [Corynebacterium alimapuense]